MLILIIRRQRNSDSINSFFHELIYEFKSIEYVEYLFVCWENIDMLLIDFHVPYLDSYCVLV